MGASDKSSYEFGSFRLEASEHILLRDGQIVPLTPKVFETLLVLVEKSGHVVDKNELYRQVWQDTFVEETNLTKNISILRKILSEGDGGRYFIETVPKRGYRFVVPVRESDSEASKNGSKPLPSLDEKKIAVVPFALSKPHVVPPPTRETSPPEPEFQPFAERAEPVGHSSLKVASNNPHEIDLSLPASTAEDPVTRIRFLQVRESEKDSSFACLD